MVAHALITRDVERAAELLRRGGLVAFATETVYGLGAAADDDQAVARVYEVKGRPTNHPLIVHVQDAEQVAVYGIDVPAYVQQLVQRLWPGPLTVIVPRRPERAGVAAAQLPTVGLRQPAHPVAAQLLAAFGDGIAAPSANRFGRVSPTTAQHVWQELHTHLDVSTDCILDGGAADVGVESTIVDCTAELPAIRRTGAYTATDIEDACGLPVVSHSTVAAPGTLAAHYAPTAHLVVVADAAGLAASVAEANADPDAVGVIALAQIDTPNGCVRLASPTTTRDYARLLYAALRQADDAGLRTVIAVVPEADGVGLAVRDRLQRAAFGSRRGQET